MDTCMFLRKKSILMHVNNKLEFCFRTVTSFIYYPEGMFLNEVKTISIFYSFSPEIQ